MRHLLAAILGRRGRRLTPPSVKRAHRILTELEARQRESD